MNKREHFVNAVSLGAALGFMVEPGADVETAKSVAEFGVPVTLGTMIPDLDTAIGDHRKTFHNLLTLAVFVMFPVFFNNLRYIWIGILSHYILDLLGTNRGMALFYPIEEEFEIPIGVPVNSILAPLMTIIVTAVMIAGCWVFIYMPNNPVVHQMKTIFSSVKSTGEQQIQKHVP